MNLSSNLFTWGFTSIIGNETTSLVEVVLLGTSEWANEDVSSLSDDCEFERLAEQHIKSLSAWFFAIIPNSIDKCHGLRRWRFLQQETSFRWFAGSHLLSWVAFGEPLINQRLWLRSPFHSGGSAGVGWGRWQDARRESADRKPPFPPPTQSQQPEWHFVVRKLVLCKLISRTGPDDVLLNLIYDELCDEQADIIAENWQFVYILKLTLIDWIQLSLTTEVEY